MFLFLLAHLNNRRCPQRPDELSVVWRECTFERGARSRRAVGRKRRAHEVGWRNSAFVSEVLLLER